MNWVKTLAFMSLLGVLGCASEGDRSGSAEADIDSTQIQTKVEKPTVFTLRAYYPFDEKYYDTTKPVSEFLIERSKDLKVGEKTYNLIQPNS